MMGQTIEISVNRINQGSRLAGSSGGTAKTYLLRQERVESSQVRVCAHALVIITRAKILLATGAGPNSRDIKCHLNLQSNERLRCEEVMLMVIMIIIIKMMVFAVFSKHWSR